MKTVVQERMEASETHARVLYGRSLVQVQGRRGMLRIFPAGELVVYLVRQAGRGRLFVFRTASSSAPGTTTVPGVQPGVGLLLVARTGRQIHRFGQLLEALKRAAYEPRTLPDQFFLRAAGLLGRRECMDDVVNVLLCQEAAGVSKRS